MKCLQTAVPWLRRSVAGLSPLRPRFDEEPYDLRYVMTKAVLAVFFAGSFGFARSVSFHQCPTRIFIYCRCYQKNKQAKPTNLPKNQPCFGNRTVLRGKALSRL